MFSLLLTLISFIQLLTRTMVIDFAFVKIDIYIYIYLKITNFLACVAGAWK